MEISQAKQEMSESYPRNRELYESIGALNEVDELKKKKRWCNIGIATIFIVGIIMLGVWSMFLHEFFQDGRPLFPWIANLGKGWQIFVIMLIGGSFVLLANFFEDIRECKENLTNRVEELARLENTIQNKYGHKKPL